MHFFGGGALADSAVLLGRIQEAGWPGPGPMKTIMNTNKSQVLQGYSVMPLYIGVFIIAYPRPTPYTIQATPLSSPLPGFWTKHLARDGVAVGRGPSGETGQRMHGVAALLIACLCRGVVVPDHGLGDDAVHRRPRGLYLRSPLWLSKALGWPQSDGAWPWGCMGLGAPDRSTPRPAHPPASRVGPDPPRRSARAALRTSRASCPGPVYVS